MSVEPASTPLSASHIYRTWWPLAASWLLMGLEMPMIAAVVSRLDEQEIHLAALGGVVFPLALLIESPIIMILAASTALCRDEASYLRLRRFMTRLAGSLTLLQIIIAFTPLFDLIVLHLIGAPEAILEPARLGMQIMTPWTWAIADRRFHQGVLIRFGRQHQVGIGTAVRLIGTVTPLLLGLALQRIPGIVVATAALSTGVMVELLYARWCVRPVIHGPLKHAPPVAIELSAGRIWRFYIPLAMTPLLALAAQPIGAAGIARMPETLASFAIWPALNGLAFMSRSTGVAYNEVVVRHDEDEGGRPGLWRFAWIVGCIVSALFVILAATPLARVYFHDITGLNEELTALARQAVWAAVPLPLLSFLVSYYQGVLVSVHRTRGITEAVAIALATTAAVLVIGALLDILPGATVAMAALTLGMVAQTAWLAVRYRQATR